MKLKLPTWLSIVLGAALGLVGALNVASFGFASPWSQLVTFACAGIAALGIAPLTHGALRTALHITYQQALVLAGFATSATAAVTATHWDSTLKGVVVGVLTAAAGVLAGPEGTAAPVAPVAPTGVPAAPGKKPHQKQ